MYKDLISYKLADGVTEERLLEVAQKIIDGWMKKQSGFLGWEITKDDDGSYTDIVSWVSKEDAKKAEVGMANIPNASAWYGCYAEGSISSKKTHRVGEYK